MYAIPSGPPHWAFRADGARNEAGEAVGIGVRAGEVIPAGPLSLIQEGIL